MRRFHAAGDEQEAVLVEVPQVALCGSGRRRRKRLVCFLRPNDDKPGEDARAAGDDLAFAPQVPRGLDDASSVGPSCRGVGPGCCVDCWTSSVATGSMLTSTPSMGRPTLPIRKFAWLADCQTAAKSRSVRSRGDLPTSPSKVHASFPESSGAPLPTPAPGVADPSRDGADDTAADRRAREDV